MWGWRVSVLSPSSQLFGLDFSRTLTSTNWWRTTKNAALLFDLLWPAGPERKKRLKIRDASAALWWNASRSLCFITTLQLWQEAAVSALQPLANHVKGLRRGAKMSLRQQSTDESVTELPHYLTLLTVKRSIIELKRRASFTVDCNHLPDEDFPRLTLFIVHFSIV